MTGAYLVLIGLPLIILGTSLLIYTLTGRHGQAGGAGRQPSRRTIGNARRKKEPKG